MVLRENESLEQFYIILFDNIVQRREVEQKNPLKYYIRASTMHAVRLYIYINTVVNNQIRGKLENGKHYQGHHTS